jgi:hypothetical protein
MKTKTTDTPRTDAALAEAELIGYDCPIEFCRQLEREVARLREENDSLKQGLPRKDSMSTNANNSQMTTSDYNDVARLRELLNRAIEIADEAIILADIDHENDKFGKVTWLKKEVAEIETEARLAPAPEEPIVVNLEPSNLFVDQKPQNVSNNEWREIQKLKTQTHYHHESYCRKCKEPK